jgi:hypothetical protein
MISRTGDLVHLNALTFFEIFGFIRLILRKIKTALQWQSRAKVSGFALIATVQRSKVAQASGLHGW